MKASVPSVTLWTDQTRRASFSPGFEAPGPFHSGMTKARDRPRNHALRSSIAPLPKLYTMREPVSILLGVECCPSHVSLSQANSRRVLPKSRARVSACSDIGRCACHVFLCAPIGHERDGAGQAGVGACALRRPAALHTGGRRHRAQGHHHHRRWAWRRRRRLQRYASCELPWRRRWRCLREALFPR